MIGEPQSTIYLAAFQNRVREATGQRKRTLPTESKQLVGLYSLYQRLYKHGAGGHGARKQRGEGLLSLCFEGPQSGSRTGALEAKNLP